MHFNLFVEGGRRLSNALLEREKLQEKEFICRLRASGWIQKEQLRRMWMGEYEINKLVTLFIESHVTESVLLSLVE